MTSDEVTERRLLQEAKERRLAMLAHPDARNNETQRVRVEVSYSENFGAYDRCGYVLALVPEIDPEGLSDDEALAAHPASLADELVNDWLNEQAQRHGWNYTSIDDTFPG